MTDSLLLIPALSVNRTGGLNPYLPWGLLSLRALAEQSCGPHVDVWYPPPLALANTQPRTSRELATAIADKLPDLTNFRAVGLSTMCGSFHHSIQLARIIKTRFPHLSLWMGGPHASSVSHELLQAIPEVDAVFVGEAEETFTEVLGRLAKNLSPFLGVAGVRTRTHEYRNREPLPDLDRLPEVSFTQKDLGQLLDQKPQVEDEKDVRALPLEVARGCPNRCAFCSTRHYWGRRIRRKSDARVLSEMRRFAIDTGIQRFDLIGDNFCASLSRLRSFCERKKAEAPDLQWMCDSTLHRLTPDDLDLLWDAGCRVFFVGLESASQSTLDQLNKGIDLKRSLDSIDRALKIGFEIKASFIVGFPWETSSDVDRTFRLFSELLKKGVTQCQLWLLCPLPGTDLSQRFEIVHDRYSSRIAMDGIPLDEDSRELVSQYPAMFSQLGRYAAGNLDPLTLNATVESAAQLNMIYSRSRCSAIP